MDAKTSEIVKGAGLVFQIPLRLLTASSAPRQYAMPARLFRWRKKLALNKDPIAFVIDLEYNALSD